MENAFALPRAAPVSQVWAKLMERTWQLFLEVPGVIGHGAPSRSESVYQERCFCEFKIINI